jgi:hypothetical protein
LAKKEKKRTEAKADALFPIPYFPFLLAAATAAGVYPSQPTSYYLRMIVVSSMYLDRRETC